MRPTRAVTLGLVAALAALLAVLGVPSRASAHGALKRSEPANGAHLSTAPRQLRLTFNEAVELAVARVELIGPDSVRVALSPLRRGDSAAVIVTDVIGPLVAGTYTVAWQIAGRDGHPVRDRFRFTIAPGAAGLGPIAAAPTAAESPAGDSAAAPLVQGHHDPVTMPSGEGFDAESPAFAAVRWLGFTATLALIGILGFGLVVLPAARRGGALPAAVHDAAASRLPLPGVAAAVLLLVAAALRLVAQSVAMHGGADAFDAALVAAMVGGTLWGTGWLVQVAAAALALAGFLALRRGRAAGWPLAAAAAVAAALSASISGHAAAVRGATALAVTADVAHVLAAGGWLGTLLALTAVGLPAARRAAREQSGAAVAAMVRAFSPAALACAAVVAVTGVVSAWLHLGTPGALAGSGYGRTLVVKLVLLALVAATGAYNWRRVQPALSHDGGPARLRRSSTVELALGALVLVVTAVLVATPTPVDLPD